MSTFLCVDTGVGAGIDSYYEYLLKSYVLLGEKVSIVWEIGRGRVKGKI